MNIGQSFQSMFDTVVRTLPQIVVFVVVLVVGWIIAKILRNVVTRLLQKVHFDRLTERGFVGQALSRSDYTASGLVGTLVYYAILLVALQMAFGVFGANPISAFLTAIVAWIPRLIVAIVLVVIAAAVGHALKNITNAALGDLSYGRLLANIVEIFVVALGVIAALNQIGVATAITGPVLVAVLATVGAILAIGLGGGLIRPMQARWERWLEGVERETRSRRGGARERGREDAMRGEGVASGMPHDAGATSPAGTGGRGMGGTTGTGTGTGGKGQGGDPWQGQRPPQTP
ncbi:hypothetical protein LO762_26625 [Actinocorallia sp. API 0066]|uniref:mechanosensitive ion channel family protein n=1 Tax=Actinocorallia sp. API 0066 TaxID=2896846 RepID=UPI001E57808D|nr:hypothetical protein [Actinocorallia sp. API 0066]MCD0452730.1 hypothetical protein [Actinocorallia sp. API 0066]